MKKALVMIGCSFIGAVFANVALGVVGSKILTKVKKEITKDVPIEERVGDEQTVNSNN